MFYESYFAQTRGHVNSEKNEAEQEQRFNEKNKNGWQIENECMLFFAFSCFDILKIYSDSPLNDIIFRFPLNWVQTKWMEYTNKMHTFAIKFLFFVCCTFRTYPVLLSLSLSLFFLFYDDDYDEIVYNTNKTMTRDCRLQISYTE